MKRLMLMAALVCSTASAVDLPVGSDKDGRIQSVNYSADDVVNVRLATGRITRIILDEDEIGV